MLPLLAITAALVALLRLLALPAAFLLGAMAGAMIVASRGTVLRMPGWVFSIAQAVVGCLIARSFTPALFRAIGRHPALYAGAALSVLVVATGLGLLLARLRVLPGSTALWGSFPGAATVMVLLSDSFGGDMRLVALMQYLRVVVVAVTASIVGRVWAPAGATPHAPPWVAPVAWPSFGFLAAIILFGGLAGPRIRMPAAPLFIPLVLATALQDFGYLRIELPQPLLAASYLVIGWAIGLRFTGGVFRQAAGALARVLASVLALVGICAAIGWGLARIAHLDALTAYLATSPGGADSVAIIAAGVAVDVPLVMAVQTCRFLSVLLLGPALAKGAARLAGTARRPGAERPGPT